MTCVISVTNEKGGVAKTTTALSLGASLVESGKTVLLIDLDAQANLTLAVGADPEATRYTILDAVIRAMPLKELWLETGIPGLFLLPANHDLGFSDRLLPARPKYEYGFRAVIERSNLPFDYIILDCPPFLGSLVLNALVASEFALIPTQPEFFSIYGLRNLMALIRRVRSQYNPDLAYRLLITMFDGRNRIHRMLTEQLRLNYEEGLLQTVIMVDTRLRECNIAGLPIIYHSPRSRSALQYRALTEEIRRYVEEKAPRPA